jgi:hypothetical protein
VKKEFQAWAIVLMLLAALSPFGFIARAQEKAKPATPGPPFELTETQHLKLENVQLKYALAKTQFDAAQKALNEAAAAFNQEVEAVKKENSWPADLAFDFQALKFSEVPKPAEKPKPADPPKPPKAKP